MIKIHFKLIYIGIFLLTGCYPCKFLDWNCNASIADEPWYKASLLCKKTQQSIAKEILQEKYTEDINLYISDKCAVSDAKYKFILDPKFSGKR
ncbi:MULTISPECIES: hypothetical protein [Pasteurellaceae]|uniref:hypothetical protein n=1 Tax=Pasteurellaceae TaxID=712 RepID=UPI00053217F0|nr:hypothetical protein [Gallibacterium anatis]KGQ47236.1 hypothetical protein JL04_10815 [Gallibacterium anatis]KGQ68441.1 hypothetical protein IO47_04880 [Gallibacterium anatis]